MSAEKVTYIEHSGVYANGVEITSVYCGGCDKIVEFKIKNGDLADLDSCGCVRIEGRLALETKGSTLCKKSYMYDEEEEDEDNYDDCANCHNNFHKDEGEYHDEYGEIWHHEVFICHECAEDMEEEEE